jgi:hypothetical protein
MESNNDSSRDGLLFSKINPRILRVLVVPELGLNLTCSSEFEIINSKIEINNYSHKNYIYKKKCGQITYIFNGFFKDDYFVISIDSYNELLMTEIEHKDIIILKLNWVIKNDCKNDCKNDYKNDSKNDSKIYWELDIPNKKNKIDECYILPIRKDLFENYNTSFIQNYLITNKVIHHLAFLMRNTNSFFHSFTHLRTLLERFN